MGKPVGNVGLRRLLNATRCSFIGIGAACRYEAAFRQELFATLVMLPLAFWLGENGMERALLIGVWMLVLIAELLNSGIEAVVDRIGEEHHILAGRAKDMGSAAVLIALLNVGVVWLLILF